METLETLSKLSNAEKDALILHQQQTIMLLMAKIAQLEEYIHRQDARIKDLEDRLAKNSHNSHKPPSSDGLKKVKSTRQPSGKKPGGQEGHPGGSLKLSETPNEIILYPVSTCRNCQRSLSDKDLCEYELRQQFDILIKSVIMEYRCEIKACPDCGTITRGEFPPEVNGPVSYGLGLKSLLTYLNTNQLIPLERACDIIDDLVGLRVSAATVCAANDECDERIVEPVAQIKEQVTQAEVLQADETGARVSGKTKWLHTASTQDATYYAIHEKRGREGSDAIGILPNFRGDLVHDGFKPYQSYLDCRHSLCNAHHLRELTYLEERENQAWAGKMIKLLVKIKDTVDDRKKQGGTALEPWELAAFEQEYGEILAEGLKATAPPETVTPEPPKKGRKKQSPAKNMLDRLLAHQAETLRFMHDFRIPFDNNLAERDLRMMKLRQKISGCFRTQKGAEQFCRIRSYISTLKKRGINVMDGLMWAFAGKPFACKPA